MGRPVGSKNKNRIAVTTAAIAAPTAKAHTGAHYLVLQTTGAGSLVKVGEFTTQAEAVHAIMARLTDGAGLNDFAIYEGRAKAFTLTFADATDGNTASVVHAPTVKHRRGTVNGSLQAQA